MFLIPIPIIIAPTADIPAHVVLLESRVAYRASLASASPRSRLFRGQTPPASDEETNNSTQNPAVWLEASPSGSVSSRSRIRGLQTSVRDTEAKTWSGWANTKASATIIGNWSWSEVLWSFIAVIIGIFVLLYFKKIFGFLFEVMQNRRMVVLRVMLPRADSKLDKEHETKKDFKEKVGQMTLFYRAIHKISKLSLADTFTDALLHHTKVSFEMRYAAGQLAFYVVAYPGHVKLINQQITSNYPDADVSIVAKDDFDIYPHGYRIKFASVRKSTDSVFPIKSYKYFESDPLTGLTNSFGMLKKDDMAVFQITLKPLGPSWNKKAKEAASKLSKGTYRKTIYSGNPLLWIWQRFCDLVHGIFSFGGGSDDKTHPGASSGDSYKIFNQAEQEAHKMVGEAASQPAFESNILMIVSSRTFEDAQEWQQQAR
jgi:hypothetical protein